MNWKILNLSKSLAIICLTLIFSSFTLSQGIYKYDEKTEQAKQFIETGELRLKETADLGKQYMLLTYLAPAALAGEDKDKVKTFARQLMVVTEKWKVPRAYEPSTKSYAVHISNIVLGHIALDDGDVNLAKQHLLAAGQISGHPVLVSFGPDMSLAKRLLETGERDAVIEYLDLCAKFWKLSRGKLETWKDNVNNKQIPAFGKQTKILIESWQSAQYSLFTQLDIDCR